MWRRICASGCFARGWKVRGINIHDYRIDRAKNIDIKFTERDLHNLRVLSLQG